MIQPTLTFDTSQLNRQLAALHDAFIGRGQKGDAETLIVDETRRLLTQAQRFTPPKSLTQGRRAVARDIGRAVTPASEEMFKNPKLRARVRPVIKKRDYADFRSILENSKAFPRWAAEPFNPSLHKGKRDNRGRVTSVKRVFTLDVAEWKRYVAKVQKMVGFMRAGWGPALNKVGGKMVSWVARHVRQGKVRGYVIADLQGETKSITINNHTRGVGQTRHQFQSALYARARNIGRRVKLILSGYNRDMARSMRPRQRAQETNVSSAAE